MEPPPVRYVNTSDGLRIAYTVFGSGTPFVSMPINASHAGLGWRRDQGPPVFGPSARSAALLGQRFRVVTFDRRGQGLSTRGLGPDHTYDDYLLDLEAVVDRLELSRFVLYGALYSAHCAIRYAAAHPERLRALVLRDVQLSYEAERGFVHDSAAQNWGLFTEGFARAGLRTDIQDWHSSVLTTINDEKRYLEESVDVADWLAMVRSLFRSDVSADLARIQAPTLVMAGTTRERYVKGSEEAAAAIPNARLAVYPGETPWVGRYPEGPSRLSVMLDFLDETLAKAPPGQPLGLRGLAGLSPRELEVLSLVAEGKSNQQIAESLVISSNTVARHVSHILDKIGVANRLEAAAHAHRMALV